MRTTVTNATAALDISYSPTAPASPVIGKVWCKVDENPPTFSQWNGVDWDPIDRSSTVYSIISSTVEQSINTITETFNSYVDDNSVWIRRGTMIVDSVEVPYLELGKTPAEFACRITNTKMAIIDQTNDDAEITSFSNTITNVVRLSVENTMSIGVDANGGKFVWEATGRSMSLRWRST